LQEGSRKDWKCLWDARFLFHQARVFPRCSSLADKLKIVEKDFLGKISG
jgi:hypothetical protein